MKRSQRERREGRRRDAKKRTSVGVVSPSIDVSLEMSSVGKLGVVLLLLRPRSLGLGGVELGEVSFVAVRRKKESKIEVSSIREGGMECKDGGRGRRTNRDVQSAAR